MDSSLIRPIRSNEPVPYVSKILTYLLVVLIGGLAIASNARADLKATAVVYAWDEKDLKFQNSNVIIDLDGQWVPFLHQLNFDGDLIDTSAYGGCGNTSFAGTMEYGLYHTDTAADYYATGFIESRSWMLVACDRNGDGSFNNADLSYAPPTAVSEYTGGDFQVLSIDVVTACTTGNCLNEIVTTMFLNIDTDCDGNINADIPAGGLCFYAEAKKPGTETNPWEGPLQARISAGGGDKTVNFNPRPTIASISDFSAAEENGSVVVKWQTNFELGTVGFDLYRYDSQQNRFLQLNQSLLTGLLTSPQGGTYQFADRGAKAGDTYTYRLVEVDHLGAKNTLGTFTVTPAAAGPTRAAADREPDSFIKKAANRSQQMQARLQDLKNSKKMFSKQKKARQGSALKMGVETDGLYYLSAETISEKMNTSAAEVRDWIKTSKLQLINQWKAVAYLPAADDSGIYFYGQAPDSPYSDNNIYWLIQNNALVMKTNNGKSPDSPAPANQSFADSYHAEENRYALTGLFSDPEADYWLWEYLVANDPVSGTRNFRVPTLGGVPFGSATVKVKLQGATDSKHLALVSLADQKIAETSWQGISAHEFEFTIPSYMALFGEMDLSVTAALPKETPYSIFYVDAIDITYPRYYQAFNDQLYFTGNGYEKLTVSGFSGPQIMLFDISDPRHPEYMDKTTVTSMGGSYQVSFIPKSADSRYLAAGPGAVTSGIEVLADSPSDLLSTTNQADYLIIAPSHLVEAAQQLADYRQNQGYESMLIDLEDIYDQANCGNASPYAIKAFLAYARLYWQTPPQYVVLVGDGTYDYKDYQGQGDNLIPVLLVSTPYGLTASDNSFVDFDDDGVPEMSIGRLPVATAKELATVISKITTFESGSGEWKSNLILAADKPDEGGNFPADSEIAAALVPSTYIIDRIYAPAFSTAVEATEALVTSFGEGAMLVNYIGHGGRDRLGMDGMLTMDSIPFLRNSDQYPVLTALTCIAGQFSIPGFDSIGERILLAADGGTSAVWSPSGLSYNSESMLLEKGFMEAFFQQPTTIGNAVLGALAYAKDQGIMLYMPNIYNLLGDPAMSVQ